MSDENFAALPPVPATITIAGETLDITPLKVGELPAFARAVRPIAEKITATPDWLSLLSDHGEHVIEALAIASRRDVAWVAGLNIDDAIRLAEVVFEVNADFFVKKIVPEIERASLKISKTLGQIPSSA